MSDAQLSSDLLAIYAEYSRAHLDALDHCLLTLERTGLEPEALAALLGPLHTLKGNSGMVGFSGVKDYVHRLEDAVERLRDRRLPADAATWDRLLAGAAALREAVELGAQAGVEVRDLAPEQAELDVLLTSVAAAAPLEPAAEPEAQRAPGARSSVVRVDFARLDYLLNLVGELVIHRTKLHDSGKLLAQRLRGDPALRDLLDALQQVERVSSELQATVMDVRMLPVRQVFERFPRLVRDLARAQGKDIELILEGEGTRVDKAVIDEIGEPLVHMVRNSVDHGIETPDERVRHGKTRTGTILLSAAQESNHVVITIMDDGAGIDAARVRSKAIERGVLRGHETLGERETVQLIFAPGFSTADSVTDVSGRGVGLDVVLRSIERLNGLVEVESLPGVGTKFVIQLPLTLAIIAALLVEAGDEVFALPLSSVVESLRFSDDDVHGIGGRPALRLRERVVPLFDLAELLGLQTTRPARARRYAVVLGRGEKRLALGVSGLRGQQEVVIKGLDAAIKTPQVAGATILGSGRVVLILDVAALFEGRRFAGGSGGATPSSPSIRALPPSSQGTL